MPDLAQVSPFTNSDETTNLQAGTTLFLAGEPGREAYVVVAGELEIRLQDKVLAIVGPGGIAGEMALIDSAPRSADCVARTDVRVVPIDQ